MARRRFDGQYGFLALLAIAALFLLATGLLGQDATGRIVGLVTDPSGSVIPKAKITVTNVGTGISSTALAGDDGAYQVLLLPVGSYRVEAEAAGFRKSVTNPQDLAINQSLKIDFKLEVGSTTETVQVEANASGVETVNSSLGQVVSGTQIANAPLNGRNVMDLAKLMPGVIPAVAGATTTAGGTAFSVAGSRTDSVSFLIDGAMNTNLLNNGLILNPNPDAVDEFKILTSNYNAEYGRNAGGIVSVVTKSGTNTFHGSAYEYVRNNYFNANSFFNNQQGLPVDVLKRNQFGAQVGGPLSIPKVINGKDRIFFMVAYQGQRLSQLQTGSSVTTFTPAELSGDFSHSNSTRTGPDPNVVKFLTNNPYFQPNAGLAQQGIIDPSRINPVSQNFIKAGLIPTSPTGVLFPQGSAIDNRDELTEKVDVNLTQNDKLSVLLGSSRATSSAPFGGGNVAGFPNFTYTHRYAGTVNYTKTISPTLLNEFRFSATRNNNFQSVPGVKLPTPQELGVGITPDDPTGPPVLSFSSGLTAGFSVQGPTALIDNTYIWRDDLIWTHGKHSVKTGFSYTPYQNNTAYDFYVNGEIYYRATNGNNIWSSNDHADFLFGLPDEIFQSPRAPSNIRSYNIAWYLQDEWKVMRNLTITLGARYEYSSPKRDTQGRSFSLAYGQQSTVFVNAPKGLLFPGDPGAPTGANFPDKNDWAPRFGFAWDPKGDGKTSIRGGFGVFYDILKAEDNLQFNGQAPFFGTADLFPNALTAPITSTVTTLSNPFAAVGQVNPFPSQPPPHTLDFAKAGFIPFGAGGVYFVNPHLRTPYVYQYNLSIQREIMRNTTLEVSYIGSSSHKLTGLYSSDPFIPGTSTRLFNAQPGVAPGTFAYLDTFDNVANAHYNSLAVGLARRLTDIRYLGGLQYQISYTYGHSIDNASGFRSRDGSVPYYNWKRFEATSDFDLTHVLSASATWSLPFDRMWESGPKRLTKGWTLFPFVTYRSGDVLDVTSGLTRSSTRPGPSGFGDSNLVRANLVSPVTYFNIDTRQTINGRSGNFFFDPRAFQALPSGFSGVSTYGTLGRNAFRGPDRVNMDLTISKGIDLRSDKMKFDIRADFFNVLNHAEFRDPSTTITSALFGTISSTGNAGDSYPRVIQLAARFSF